MHTVWNARHHTISIHNDTRLGEICHFEGIQVIYRVPFLVFPCDENLSGLGKVRENSNWCMASVISYTNICCPFIFIKWAKFFHLSSFQPFPFNCMDNYVTVICVSTVPSTTQHLTWCSKQWRHRQTYHYITVDNGHTEDF